MAHDKSTEIDNSAKQAEQAPEQGDEKLPAEEQAGEPTRSRLTFRPRVDIFETEKGLELLADMPGARPESVDITLERRELTIRAGVEEDEPDDMSLLHREYRVGDFERRFQLAGDFDTDNIEAALNDGVLHVKVPKAPQPEAKRIELKSR